MNKPTRRVRRFVRRKGKGRGKSRFHSRKGKGKGSVNQFLAECGLDPCSLFFTGKGGRKGRSG